VGVKLTGALAGSVAAVMWWRALWSFQAPGGINSPMSAAGDTLLIPVGLGLILRGLAPDFADRILPIVSRVGSIGLLIAVLVVLLILGPTLIRMDPWSYLVIAAVCIAALLIGHLLGPSDPRERTSLAVESAARHPGLAFSIAAMNFTPAKALPVMGPCILTFILIATIYMLLRGERTASGPRQYLRSSFLKRPVKTDSYTAPRT